MKKTILILVVSVSLFVSCDFKTAESSNKYDAILKIEKHYLDSLDKKNFDSNWLPSVKEGAMISDTGQKYGGMFLKIHKSAKDKKEEATIDQLQANFDFSKKITEWVRREDLSKK